MPLLHVRADGVGCPIGKSSCWIGGVEDVVLEGVTFVRGDVRPGRGVDDFAHAVWCFADLIEAAVPLDEQDRRTRLMCMPTPG